MSKQSTPENLLLKTNLKWRNSWVPSTSSKRSWKCWTVTLGMISVTGSQMHTSTKVCNFPTQEWSTKWVTWSPEPSHRLMARWLDSRFGAPTLECIHLLWAGENLMLSHLEKELACISNSWSTGCSSFLYALCSQYQPWSLMAMEMLTRRERELFSKSWLPSPQWEMLALTKILTALQQFSQTPRTKLHIWISLAQGENI